MSYRLSSEEHSILMRALFDSIKIRKRLKRPSSPKDRDDV